MNEGWVDFRNTAQVNSEIGLTAGVRIIAWGVGPVGCCLPCDSIVACFLKDICMPKASRQ